jgi:biopolymer transport protein ExbD
MHPTLSRYLLLPAALAAPAVHAAEFNVVEQASEGGVALLVILGLSILFLAVALERLRHLRARYIVPAGLADAPLVLAVDSRGKVYVGGERVTVQGLHDVLKREAARDPQRRIRIDGDEQVPYQHIVHVLDLCQFEGFTNIALHTRK